MKNVIGLIDCDSFFASCEQADNPELFGKPVCVLSQINDRGIVLARSKEVKKLGVKMCDPYFKIKGKYPEITYIASRMYRYKEISAQVMEIVKSYSPEVEVASIDEAYINLGGLENVYKKSPADIALDIRTEVFEKLKISVSIGVAGSKILAKLASEQAKQSNGIFEITPENMIEKVGKLTINNVSGIGKQHHKQMLKAGIYTIADFIKTSDIKLRNILGICGIQLKDELLGRATSKVEKDPQPPKSIQSSAAFADFTNDKYFITNSLNYHIQQACRKLRSWGGYTSVIGIMLRHKDFNVEIKKERLDVKTKSEQDIKNVVLKFFDEMYRKNAQYRACGISLDDISFHKEAQQNLFNEPTSTKSKDKLCEAIDKLESKFGSNIVKSGWI